MEPLLPWARRHLQRLPYSPPEHSPEVWLQGDGRPQAHVDRVACPGSLLHHVLRPVEIAHDRGLPRRVDDPVRK